jgi:hypothetical protein
MICVVISWWFCCIYVWLDPGAYMIARFMSFINRVWHIPCLMVGPRSGTRPRPTQTPPSDVMQGRAWHPQWRRVQYRTLNSATWPETYVCFVIISPVGKAMSLLNTHVIYLPVMWNVMAFVSLDSPSCGVPCWSCFWLFIGTLPDRPRDYTVWSTSEPAKVDSRTWAGVIWVGSATSSCQIVDSLDVTRVRCNDLGSK